MCCEGCWREMWSCGFFSASKPIIMWGIQHMSLAIGFTYTANVSSAEKSFFRKKPLGETIFDGGQRVEARGGGMRRGLMGPLRNTIHASNPGIKHAWATMGILLLVNVCFREKNGFDSSRGELLCKYDASCAEHCGCCFQQSCYCRSICPKGCTCWHSATPHVTRVCYFSLFVRGPWQLFRQNSNRIFLKTCEEMSSFV